MAKKIGFGFLGILLLAFIVVLLGGNYFAENFIENKVAKMEGISYKKVEVSLFSGNASFKGVDYSKDGINANAGQISIRGVGLFNYLFNNVISVEELDIDSLDFAYSIPEHKNNEDSSKSNSSLPEIELGKFSLTNSQISISRPKEQSPFAQSGLYIVMTKILSADLKSMDSLAKRLDLFTLSRPTFNTKDGLYTASSSRISYNSEAESISADSLRYACKYDKLQLAKTVGKQQTWVDFKSSQIVISASNLSEIVDSKIIRKISIQQPKLHGFLDKQADSDNEKRPKLLKEMLATSPFSFGIDSIIVSEGEIIYEEQLEDKDEAGRVTFEQFNAQLTDLYTFDKENENSPRLRADCLLFGEGKLYADVSFPRTATGNTVVKGRLEQMSLTAFNPMISPWRLSESKVAQTI